MKKKAMQKNEQLVEIKKENVYVLGKLKTKGSI